MFVIIESDAKITFVNKMKLLLFTKNIRITIIKDHERYAKSSF